MVKNIIFDFGGVVLRHGKKIIEKILVKMFSISYKEAVVFWRDNKSDLMTGRESSEQFLSKIKKKLGSNLEVKKLKKMWLKLYKIEANNVDRQLLKLAKDLKVKYKVYLFTDTIDLHDNYNSTRAIYEKFDRVFKSFEQGFKKPEREAYLNVLKKIKAKPEECVFIDDTEKNVKVAIKLGMKGIFYKNLEQLKAELVSLGIW